MCIHLTQYLTYYLPSQTVRFIFPSDRVEVADLSSQMSLLSLSLVYPRSSLPSTRPLIRFSNVDARFGKRTYKEVNLSRKEGSPGSSLSMYLLPAGSEMQIPDLATIPVMEADDAAPQTNKETKHDNMAVVLSVMCVLQHKDRDWVKTGNSTAFTDREEIGPLVARSLWCAVKSLLGTESVNHGDRKAINAAVDPSISTTMPLLVNIMLGKGSVGSAWWDCVR